MANCSKCKPITKILFFRGIESPISAKDVLRIGWNTEHWRTYMRKYEAHDYVLERDITERI